MVYPSDSNWIEYALVVYGLKGSFRMEGVALPGAYSGSCGYFVIFLRKSPHEVRAVQLNVHPRLNVHRCSIISNGALN